MRKPYASQESIAETLTAAERAAPFALAPADAAPLKQPTRRAVIVKGRAVERVVGHFRIAGGRREWVSGAARGDA